MRALVLSLLVLVLFAVLRVSAAAAPAALTAAAPPVTFSCCPPADELTLGPGGTWPMAVEMRSRCRAGVPAGLWQPGVDVLVHGADGALTWAHEVRP